MKTIYYELDSEKYLVQFNIEVEDIYIVVPEQAENITELNPDEIPNYPLEVLELIDNQLTINQDKLVEFNRQNMPTLKPIDFDIKLNDAGLYDAVQELIKDNFNLRIAYNRATYFSRTDPFIDQARIVLGLTNEQVDEIWTS